MKTLSLDSASGITGFAFRDEEGKFEWGSLHKPTQAKRIDLIKRAVEAGCTHVAIEYPFSGARANLGILLGIAYGKWLSECQREGLSIIANSMRASDWQRHVLGKVPKGESKLWARNKAGEATGYSFRKCEQDAADAVCMLLYAEDLATLGLLATEGKV
jgi:hypothetical protein